MHGRRELFLRTLEDAVSRRGVALMGICNVTPDSFSDGGRYLRIEDAVARVQLLIEEGASFIDVGGESTRPGAALVPAREQIARVVPVLRAAAAKGLCVSVDTMSAEVAEASLEAGASIVNDVSCLADAELARVVARADATLVLMHSRPSHFAQSEPENPYGDVVADVVGEWQSAVARAGDAGLRVDAKGALVMDPGLGFAKAARTSAELLARTREVVDRVGVPVLVGASRKSFLKLVDPSANADERIGGSVAAALFAARSGAKIVRVHDVRATRQALDVERMLARGGAHA